MQSLVQILKEISCEYVAKMDLIKRRKVGRQIEHAPVRIPLIPADFFRMQTWACLICLQLSLGRLIIIIPIISIYLQLFSLRICTNDCIVGCARMRLFWRPIEVLQSIISSVNHNVCLIFLTDEFTLLINTYIKCSKIIGWL